MCGRVIATINLEMTERMAKKIIPLLQSLGDTQIDREISLPKAAEKYGWSITTLRRLVVIMKKIPYRQNVPNGTIYLKDSDCRKLQGDLKGKSRAAKAKTPRKTRKIFV